MSSESEDTEAVGTVIEYDYLEQVLKRLQTELERLKQQENALLKETAFPTGSRDEPISQETRSLKHRLMLHKLAGVTQVKHEKREAVFEFSASWKGKYFGPYYLRIRKESGMFNIASYWLPDSLPVRKMIQEKPLVKDEELLEFLQLVQRCVVAFHRRKEQITEAKELLKEKEDIRFFVSIDYRFIEMDIDLRKLDSRPFQARFSLVYDRDKDVPSTLRISSEDATKEDLDDLHQEFQPLTEMTINNAVLVFFIKTEPTSESSSLSSSSVVPEGTDTETSSIQ